MMDDFRRRGPMTEIISRLGTLESFMKEAKRLWGLGGSSSGSGLTSGPEAFGDNYVITPSIAANNLTVAIKTIAGADPSAGDSVWWRIANTKRTLTAALSVTVNAGASVFNAGSTEIKNNDIQPFVYIGYRASDASLFIGISRIPWGKTYADFSSTNTNEKYLAYSGAAPAATDPVEVIGRIQCQNSGTASYNWSIPNPLVVNWPTYETDWLTWAPQNGAGFTQSSLNFAKYRFTGPENKAEFEVRITGTTTAVVDMKITSFFTALQNGVNVVVGAMLFHDSGSDGFGGCYMSAGTPNIINFRKYNASNWAAAAGSIGSSEVCSFEA